eukprot:tig00021127_g18844.t1
MTVPKDAGLEHPVQAGGRGLAGWVEQRLLRLAEERGGKEELERGEAAEAEGREAWPAHLRLGARLLGRGGAGAEAALLRGLAAPALDATVTLALLARCGGELGRRLAGGAAGEAAGALAEGRAMWGHSCRCPHFDAGGSHEPAALLAAALALYGACGLDGEPLRARFAAAAAAAAAGRGRGGRRRGGRRRRRRGGAGAGPGVWRAHWRGRPVAVKARPGPAPTPNPSRPGAGWGGAGAGRGRGGGGVAGGEGGGLRARRAPQGGGGGAGRGGAGRPEEGGLLEEGAHSPRLPQPHHLPPAPAPAPQPS